MPHRFKYTVFVGSSLALTMSLMPAASYGQTPLPQVTVETTKPKPKPKRAVVRRIAPPPAAPAQTQQATLTPAEAAQRAVANENVAFDRTRAYILAPIGANSYQISHSAIEAMPQNANTSLDKVLL
jgi:hypothetical protein